MIASPKNIRPIGSGLDHPECVCLAPDGMLYAGGEAGQVYRLARDGSHQEQIGSTGGFALGIAYDGSGSAYICDCGKASVYRVGSGGAVTLFSAGAPDQAAAVPNFGVFDQAGHFYFSDSGDYWSDTGTGRIFVVDCDGGTRLFHRGPFRFANGLAISPDQKWLYVVQSTASNVSRIPLDRPDGNISIMHELPQRTVPDGIAFAADGRLLIACYKPDALFMGYPDGRVELFVEDPTGELLSRPTNVAIGSGEIYISNLGGWSIAAMRSDLPPAPIHYPALNASQ
jgi:gluconolactonase